MCLSKDPDINTQVCSVISATRPPPVVNNDVLSHNSASLLFIHTPQHTASQKPP